MTKNEINLKKQTFPSFLVLRYEISDMNNILPFFTSSFLLLLDMYLIYNLFFKAGLNLSDIHVTHFPNASPTRLRKTMYRGEMVWCTAYCQTDSFLIPCSHSSQLNKKETSFLERRVGWLWACYLPLAPSALQNQVPLEQKKHPST